MKKWKFLAMFIQVLWIIKNTFGNFFDISETKKYFDTLAQFQATGNEVTCCS